jgi:hypothetical protein
MTYLAIGLVAAWCCGFLFLLGRTLNFVRLIYNNRIPGKNDWGSRNLFRFYFFSFRSRTIAGAIDPTSLTEIGRQYRKRAIQNEWMIFAWALGGFVLIAWAFS